MSAINSTFNNYFFKYLHYLSLIILCLEFLLASYNRPIKILGTIYSKI